MGLEGIRHLGNVDDQELIRRLADVTIEYHPVSYSNNYDTVIYKTMELIAKLINKGKMNPKVIYTARYIAKSTTQRDKMAEVQAIHEWVLEHKHYANDPLNFELLTPADWLIRDIEKDGSTTIDCDEAVILEGSLLEALGYPVTLSVISTTMNPSDDYEHIYLSTEVGGQKIPLDPIMDDKPMGWELEGIYVKKKQIYN